MKPKATFHDMKEQIYKNFTELKRDCIQKQLLDKFGLTHNEVKELAKRNIANPFMLKLIESVSKFELSTNLMLVGFDGKKAQIAEIQENGFVDLGDIHFHAIGSGQTQAINTLLFQKQLVNNTLLTTVYNVYKAKRNAEVSSGVGKETDMLIMTGEDCFDLDENDLKILSEIYENELEIGKNSKRLDEINIFKEETI